MVVTEPLFNFVYKKIDTRKCVVKSANVLSLMCSQVNQCVVERLLVSKCVLKSTNVLSRSNCYTHACHYVLSIMTMMYAVRVNDFCWTNNFLA